MNASRIVGDDVIRLKLLSIIKSARLFTLFALACATMKSSGSAAPLSRRKFLSLTAAAVAAPTIIHVRALGGADVPAPSNRITLGLIGCGNMGTSNARSFLNLKDCQVVAACDVDKKHLQNAVNVVKKHYSNTDCKPYHDFRELLARTDIDAVMIATPDH